MLDVVVAVRSYSEVEFYQLFSTSSFTPLDASYMSSKVTKDESHLKKAPTFQSSSGHQGLESNILFGANSGPISVMADTGGAGAASSVAISSSSTVLGSTTSTTTMPKQPSVLGSRGLIQVI